MVNAPISFQFAGLPGGLAYCFTTPQRLALDIAAGLSGFLPGTFNKIINSNSEPSVNDRVDSLWFKTSAGRLYYYDGGWISPNLADANERRIFVGAESAIWSYDGGDGSDPSTTPPTAKTGAMWERDTAFDFRMPLGVGTSPAPNNTVVAVGGTGGEEKHTLTEAEIPAHTHKVQSLGQICSVTSTNTRFGGKPYTDTPDFTAAECPMTNSTGGGTSHQNMPPFLGVYFIKRTGRTFFVA